MNGLMMQWPLLISSLLTHAERHHGEQQIVSRRVEGDVHRYTYRDMGQRVSRLAHALAARRIEGDAPRHTYRDRGQRVPRLPNALAARGIQQGARVATLAWNGYRHM